MRMYPVRGRGEACLRPKTVFICVYHGWVGVPLATGAPVRGARARAGQLPVARQNRGLGETG
jgi:hypothetical protein